ncbi:MAG: GNAT family N-acetyltransferase [candidate division WOR-3 bacterium]
MKDFIYPKANEANRIIRLIASVMTEDPLNIYFLPDAEQRKKLLFYLYQPIIRSGIQNRYLFITSKKCEGTALWLPPQVKEINFFHQLLYGGLAVFTKIGLKAIHRMINYQKFCRILRERYAPFPHWYLMLIAVAKEWQGKGFASQLVKPILHQADLEKRYCYLETQNEENLPIYEHFGFEVVAERAIPDTSIRHWCLLRNPNSANAVE